MSQKFVTLGLRPLGMGCELTLEAPPFLRCVTMPNLGTDADRSATYDFMDLSRTVSEKTAISVESRKIFPPPVYLTPPPR